MAREHSINPDTDRCVMCGRNRFNREHYPECDYVPENVPPVRTPSSDIDIKAIQKAVEQARNCPTCGKEQFDWRRYGEDCCVCLAKKEKERWDALTVEQKLDELKARMDAAGPAIEASWRNVPIGG